MNKILYSYFPGVGGDNCEGPYEFYNGKWAMKHNPKVVIYTCHSGYKLSGPVKQLCLSNGTWDPPESPVCLMGKYKWSKSYFNNKVYLE